MRAGQAMNRDALSAAPQALVVGLARTGDRDAFGELVRRQQSWIRNLLRRCCGDVTLADDLAQVTFVQAYKDIRKLREPRKFPAWLKQVAINVWLQHARKHDVLGDATQSEELPLHAPTTPALGMDLDSALKQLNVDERLCVVLSYHEGMTHSEIEQATNLPLGTVKSHITRGSARLRKLLSDYSDADQPGEVT